MFTLQQPTNQLYRHYTRYGAAGFIIIGIGYLIREQFVPTHPALVILLGTFPNLVGSFATPFVLLLLLYHKQKHECVLSDLRTFGLVNIFTFAGSLLVEVLHVVFRIGVIDGNDMLASIIGASTAMLLFARTSRVLQTGSSSIVQTINNRSSTGNFS